MATKKRKFDPNAAFKSIVGAEPEVPVEPSFPEAEVADSSGDSLGVEQPQDIKLRVIEAEKPTQAEEPMPQEQVAPVVETTILELSEEKPEQISSTISENMKSPTGIVAVAETQANKAGEEKPRKGKKSKAEKDPEQLVLKGFYISEKLQRAMRLRIALSDNPDDRDMSSIARKALSVYLAPELKEKR